MKKLALLIALVSVVSLTFANKVDDKKENARTSETITQTNISGTIIDQATGEALVGVKVELEGTGKVAYTDFDGNFTFDAVKRGKYSIKTNYISYKNSVYKNINTDFNNSLEIKLSNL